MLGENGTFITHRGKKILYLCYRNLDPNAVLALAQSNIQLLKSQTSPYLLLADYRDITANDSLMNLMKSKESTESLQKAIKIAVLGISGVKQILFNAVNGLIGKKGKAFDGEEEALDYLIQ